MPPLTQGHKEFNTCYEKGGIAPLVDHEDVFGAHGPAWITSIV